MKYTIRFSPFAKEDKKEIITYLSKFYPETPRRFIASLKEHIANLKDNPYIYPEYPENTDYHRMFVGNYIIFYKINNTKKQIDIYRILRASWDLPKYVYHNHKPAGTSTTEVHGGNSEIKTKKE